MITKETVSHVAKLARLDLDPQEEERLTRDLDAILDYVDQLAEVDVTGVAPTAMPIPVTNVLRPDQREESLTREEVLRNAPAPEQGMFRVPRIIGDA